MAKKTNPAMQQPWLEAKECSEMTSFELRKKMCSTCIFGPNAILDDDHRGRFTTKEQLKNLQEAWIHHDAYAICHHDFTEHGDRTRRVCCRGFYDAHPGLGSGRRYAEEHGLVREVD